MRTAGPTAASERGFINRRSSDDGASAPTIPRNDTLATCREQGPSPGSQLR